ncbi:MAG TPA: hypothetical protein DEB30_04205 [Candidatus Peribacter riflensis]|nr:hypothetical protein [Candidatus Peribacter riflensis]
MRYIIEALKGLNANASPPITPERTALTQPHRADMASLIAFINAQRTGAYDQWLRNMNAPGSLPASAGIGQ